MVNKACGLLCGSISAIEEGEGFVRIACAILTYIENNVGTKDGDKEEEFWEVEDVKGGSISITVRLADREEKVQSSVFSGERMPSRGKQKGIVLIFMDGLTIKQFENISQLTVMMLS